MTTDSVNLNSAYERLESIRTAVSARVLASFEETVAAHEVIGPEIQPLIAVARSLLPGGKRLRAGFTAAGWCAFGGQFDAEEVVAAGAGVELFQAAALVHDDIIDDSHTRRGIEAAHLQLARLHQHHHLTGDGPRFGRAGAILLGDLLLVAAVREFDRALDGLGGNARGSASRIVTEMMAGVTLGQYLDIYAQSAQEVEDPAVVLDRAERVLRAKSARYSVEQPLCLGAAMAGGEAEDIRRCAAIGVPIGEAFQLRDDLLGVFGDPDVTGKPAADDLREGKRTVLVAIALERAVPEDATRLRAALGDAALSGQQVHALRSIITGTGAPAVVESMIRTRTDVGLGALEDAQLAPEAVAMVRTLAAAAVARSS
ncbi:polyprenyl synthetase family protein [Ruania alkalisoli]|uniref:Polyprenyl synthetase family protein n=1 Tax=Ruania alkalisoli TaxID=2779775 RepID=A0A7M1SQ60_9MICO|nr:polyprenyl synthetase family protein [Ruania alkalisoli]QOR69144.1 polyprenyl synthetase family protein [Ruania alkalisoli]